MWPTDSKWKASVNDRLVELRMSRAELARRLGVTNASVSNMLSPNVQQSRLVPLVHAALAWPAPSSVTGRDFVKMLIDSQWDRMTADQRDAIRVLVEAFTRTR